MKNHRRQIILAAVATLGLISAAPTAEAGGMNLHIGSGGFGVSVGFGDWGIYTSSWSDPYWSLSFDGTLAGYGEWTWVHGLGRAWRPWVATSWRPYTYGRWASTSCGWTWVAYEPWGYIPHHYGSWAYTAFGWVWVPGYSYSCANVVWVRAGGYVGWYARPPWGWSHSAHGFHHGYTHGYRTGFGDGYSVGYSDGWRDARYGTYVDWRHFGSENVSRHSVSHGLASASRIEGLDNGPTADEIRRRGGPAVIQTQLSRRTVKVDGREVIIARPEGMAPSIERNAAATVGNALSRQATERRQPLAANRSDATAGSAASSRAGVFSQSTGIPDARLSTRSTSSQLRQPAVVTTRSASDRPAADNRSGSRFSTRGAGSTASAGSQAVDLSRLRSRRTEDFKSVGDRGSQAPSSASQHHRSEVERQRMVQPSRQTSAAARSQSQSRAPQVDSQESATTRQPTAQSRRSVPQSPNRSPEKGSEESSRRRRD